MGFPSFTPVQTIFKNVAQNLRGVPHMLKLKVDELNNELKKSGLPIKGNKKKIHQLFEAEMIQGGTWVEDRMQNRVENLARGSFGPGAHWEIINCYGEYLD